MISRMLTTFVLLVSSATAAAQGQASTQLPFSHYACGSALPVNPDFTSLHRAQGSELRAANNPTHEMFTSGNLNNGKGMSFAMDHATLNADGSLSIQGSVDIAESEKNGGGYIGRAILTYSALGSDRYSRDRDYISVEKATGQVLTEEGITSDALSWKYFYSRYNSFHYIEPVLTQTEVDIRISNESITINLNPLNTKVSETLCGSGSTAYAVFAK